MNAKILNRALCFGIAAALVLPVAGTAVAQQSANAIELNASAPQIDAIALLTQATGLTEREVKLILGRRGRALDILDHDFAHDRFRRAVGHDVYEHLKTRGELTAQNVQHLATMAIRRQSEQLFSEK